MTSSSGAGTRPAGRVGPVLRSHPAETRGFITYRDLGDLGGAALAAAR